MDDQKPRDVFFFEQDGAFVVRAPAAGQAGSGHQLAEFTREDIAQMVARARRSGIRSRSRSASQHDHQRLIGGRP
jgi:hypothetical protein